MQDKIMQNSIISRLQTSKTQLVFSKGCYLDHARKKRSTGVSHSVTLYLRFITCLISILDISIYLSFSFKETSTIRLRPTKLLRGIMEMDLIKVYLQSQITTESK